MSHTKQTIFIVVLLCSLVFNIFLGGFLVGNHLARGGRPMGHHPPPPPPPGRGPFKPDLGIVRALPKASQLKIAPLVEKQKDAVRFQKRQVKEAQEEVIDQLVAEPFNSQAFSAALTQLQQERDKMQQVMGPFLMEVASQLDQEDRQRLAEAMHGPPPPRPPFEGDFPPPPPPGDME
jgi:uncharacterized membrane protein